MRAYGLMLVVLSCKSHSSPRPLHEAILGDWEVWCRTDKESTTSCLGKEHEVMVKSFAPDGTVSISVKGRGDAPTLGHWTLLHDELELTFDAGNVHLSELYRARIDDDHLILWVTSEKFGAILGRPGVKFEAPSTETSKGDRLSRTLGGVNYSIALPAGYRLARDDNNRQAWEPSSGTGFVVELTVSPRSQTLVDGRYVTRPCEPGEDKGQAGGQSQTVHGVERDISMDVTYCIAGTELDLSCAVKHTRGYLETSEKDVALAPCKTVEITTGVLRSRP